jgi:hypothetical protein
MCGESVDFGIVVNPGFPRDKTESENADNRMKAQRVFRTE